ncbi:nuclease-related domain-containing protein [Camelliibacillus cellulosilyticus]|uniref:Nuclease-related domain-containing protein n=1 Tax=Camelliibacillus cellulosilyticus TaxID=2174486 RepID=A0ABV9GMN5_9BACL
MVIKALTEPTIIAMLQALLNRLNPSHPKRQVIEESLAKYWSGYIGERSLVYYLNFLPKECLIIHNLRLTYQNHSFQMDVLILTPNFILIVEIKNHSGTLLFDEANQQLIQTFNDQIKVYPDPVQQADLQALQLRRLLEASEYAALPVETLAVVTNPATLVKRASDNTPQYNRKIIRPTKLHEKVLSLNKRWAHSSFPIEKLKKLSELLIAWHTPKKEKILEKFNIDPSEIRTGVQCPSCLEMPMRRHYGKWKCLKCLFTTENEHIVTLKEYAYLIKPSITCHEFQMFSHLPSHSTAKRLLRMANLPYTGTTKGRIYHLELDGI